MNSFRVNKPSCLYFIFPNFSIKEQLSLQKQIQGLLYFEDRMIVYSYHLQPKEKKIHFDCYGKEKDRGKKS